MKSAVDVCAGACGFRNRVVASCEDGQQVSVVMKTACPKIQKLAEALAETGGLDVYDEMDPQGSAVLHHSAKAASLCTGCVMPSAISKASQIAAGLMLPKDVTMQFSAE